MITNNVVKDIKEIMEIIAPRLKAISGFPKPRCCRSLLNGTIPPTNPIQITLRRPNWKIAYPPKLNQRKSVNNNSTTPTPTPTPTSTTTDVLCLMDSLQLPVPADIYAFLLKECTDSRDAIRGAEVHAHINRSGLHPGLLLSNRLLLMYAACGRLDAARKLFDKMTIKDSISCATMVTGYVDNDDHKEALSLFMEMQQNMGIEFIGLVIVGILKACIHTGEFELGKQIHGWILKVGKSKSLLVGSSFINFYAKFRCLEGARFVFEQVYRPDTVLWTTMIAGYCKEGHFGEVIDLFKAMGRAGANKNNFTISSALRACGRMKDDSHCGRQVHASAIKLGVETDLFVQSSLINMYGRCGLLQDARKVFEMIGAKRNDVCWNAMFNGYWQQGFYNEAIKFLYQMTAAGLQPHESVLNVLRTACGS